MAIFRYQHGEKPLEGFTIQHGLGRGGFGEVYYAISDSGREVALKAVQNYEDIELRGIKHCMNLKHAQLVSIFDIKHSEDGLPFVIMEFIDGPSLREIMDSHPEGLGPAKAAFFFQQMAKGLGYLHECGVVHRDLKPHNVFYEQGVVKIGDYSLSKAISMSHRGGHTMTVGTVHYMAPEISLGRYDHTVDIYALGVMLYEMLTGHPPFLGESMGEVLMKHVNGEVNVSHLDEPFARVIQKALSKDPADRYQSMQAMTDDLMGHADLRNSVASLGPETLTMVAAKATNSKRVQEPSAPSEPHITTAQTVQARQDKPKVDWPGRRAYVRRELRMLRKNKPLSTLIGIVLLAVVSFFFIGVTLELENPLPLIPLGIMWFVLAKRWRRHRRLARESMSRQEEEPILYAKLDGAPPPQSSQQPSPPQYAKENAKRDSSIGHDAFSDDQGVFPQASPYSRFVSLLMSLPMFLGFPIAGLQRLYVGKVKSGLLWLFTFGLLGIGQLYDLVMIALGQFKDVDGRRVLNFTQNQVKAIRQPVNQYSAVVKRQWTESRVGFRLGNLVLNLLGGVLLIAALLAGAAMSIDIPRAFASGVFGYEVQADLAKLYTIRDWNEVASVILAVLTTVTGSLAAVCLIFSRRQSTWVHLLRVPIAATGFVGSVISLGAITNFGRRWDAVAVQVNDHLVGGAIRELPELLPCLLFASICFVSGMFVLAWPAQQTETAQQAGQNQPGSTKREGMTV